MKNRIFLTASLTISLSCSLAYGHTSYIGYSGAPGSRGRCASSCHGTSGGTIEISGFPSEYAPGQTYTLTISHSGGSSIRQFNGSCRIGDGSENAGIISAGTNTATYSTSGETNGIHSSSSNQEGGTFDWTAPSEGVGEVTLYIAGLQGGFGGQNSTLEIISIEQAVGISDDDEFHATPRLLSLGNYPNPFNAMTVIRYDLPSASVVTVEIYDILGHRLETLVRQPQQAGYHQVSWDATGRSSGVYFYRIWAGDHSMTGRMLLLK